MIISIVVHLLRSCLSFALHSPHRRKWEKSPRIRDRDRERESRRNRAMPCLCSSLPGPTGELQSYTHRSAPPCLALPLSIRRGMSISLASSSRAILEQVATRVGSARGAAVAEGSSRQEGGARRASTSAQRSFVALERQLRASGGSEARLAVGSSSSRSETTPQSHTSFPVRPPRTHLPASAPRRAPLSRLFSSSSHSYAGSASSATSDQLKADRDSNAEEPPEQQVRRAWSQALASRRAQWSQSISRDGGGGSRSALPKEVFDVSFSRSQGPGGQNVNKGALARGSLARSKLFGFADQTRGSADADLRGRLCLSLFSSLYGTSPHTR